MTELTIDKVESLPNGEVKIEMHKKMRSDDFFVVLRPKDAIKWAGYLLAMASDALIDYSDY